MKKYLIIFAVIFLATSIVTINVQRNTIKKRNAEIQRIDSNWYNSIADASRQTHFLLKEKELSKKLKAERDSIAKLLNIKPKFIEKIIYQTVTERDTVVREVPVYVLGKDKWAVKDTGKCFTWSGIIQLQSDTISVLRTGFEYNNKIIETFYRKKNWFLGKRHNFVNKQSECGSVQTVEFEFVK